MKRIVVAAIALFLATGAAAVPPPAFEWNGIGSPTDREWKQFLADGSTADRPLPAGEKTSSGKSAIRLDGSSLIAVPARHDYDLQVPHQEDIVLFRSKVSKIGDEDFLGKLVQK